MLNSYQYLPIVLIEWLDPNLLQLPDGALEARNQAELDAFRARDTQGSQQGMVQGDRQPLRRPRLLRGQCRGHDRFVIDINSDRLLSRSLENNFMLVKKRTYQDVLRGGCAWETSGHFEERVGLLVGGEGRGQRIGPRHLSGGFGASTRVI